MLVDVTDTDSLFGEVGDVEDLTGDALLDAIDALGGVNTDDVACSQHSNTGCLEDYFSGKLQLDLSEADQFLSPDLVVEERAVSAVSTGSNVENVLPSSLLRPLRPSKLPQCADSQLLAENKASGAVLNERTRGERKRSIEAVDGNRGREASRSTRRRTDAELTREDALRFLGGCAEVRTFVERVVATRAPVAALDL